MKRSDNGLTWRMAARNLVRQRARSAITLTAIVFGVASLIVSGGFINDIITQLGEAFIGSQTGHVQIADARFFQSANRPSGDTLLADFTELKKRAAQSPHVANAMGRLTFVGVLNNGRRDAAFIGMGVEPAAEKRLGTHFQFVQGSDLDPTREDQVVIGEGLARSMGLAPGDPVTLVIATPDGALNTQDFEVVGVFRSFSKDFDARALRIPLIAAQALLTTEAVNVIVVQLDETKNTQVAAAALRERFADRKLEVREWQTLSDFYDKAVKLYERQFGVLQLVVLGMVLLSVANSVNMSAYERVAEFGTMRALGAHTKQVGWLLIVESFVLGLVGAVLGVLLGWLVAIVVSAIGIPMPPPPGSELPFMAQIRLAPGPMLVSACIGVFATVGAALLPAMRTPRVPLVDALRRAV